MYIFGAGILITIVMFFLNGIFRIASWFRLTIPLAYVLFVPLLFPEFGGNDLYMGIGFGIIMALVIISWIVTIRKRRRSRHR